MEKSWKIVRTREKRERERERGKVVGAAVTSAYPAQDRETSGVSEFYLFYNCIRLLLALGLKIQERQLFPSLFSFWIREHEINDCFAGFEAVLFFPLQTSLDQLALRLRGKMSNQEGGVSPQMLSFLEVRKRTGNWKKENLFLLSYWFLTSLIHSRRKTN